MMRLGGPELKLPDLSAVRDALSNRRPSTGAGRTGGGKAVFEGVKPPEFLVDLYWDLRDRHLLPVVALALVACVAAPILLAGGSKSEPPVPTPSSAATAEALPAEGQTLAVAQSEPGLREPSKRLRGLRAQDPFRPKASATGHEGGGSAGAGGSASVAVSGGGGGGATTVATTTTPSAGGESAGGGSVSSSPGGGAETAPSTHPPASKPAPQESPSSGGGNGEGGGGGHGAETTPSPSGSGQIQYFTFAIDVRIVKVTPGAKGAKPKKESDKKEGVIPPATLPGAKSPVITYIGLSPKTRQPLFLVSEEVSSMFGEGKCVAGTGRCQLLELKPEVLEEFDYGENGVRYKIEVLKVAPVTTGHS